MTNHQEVIKLNEECKKYFINKQKDGKISLDLDEFYAWVKHGFAVGVNKHCIEGKK